MWRYRVLGLILVVAALAGCEDRELREWASAFSDSVIALHEWQVDMVWPALQAYCELEGLVYDEFHPTGPTPTVRFCDPDVPPNLVPPPGPPPDWPL
jgi:hypothetical protein